MGRSQHWPEQSLIRERLKKQAAALRVAPLTHEERQAVINAPLPAVRILGHSSAWGGVYVRDTVPTDGRRVWANTPEDEEWCRSKWEQK